MRAKKEFKKGAASFYIVAFSTLVLMIIATSFAAVIISEITRTSNDDLSQSAYDSAMAGIEDAKLAIYNYQNCVLQGETAKSSTPADDDTSCPAIIWRMEHPECDMVSKILGRGSYGVIEESNVASNNMQQAYTCVEVNKSLKDIRSTLSSSNMIKVEKVKFDGVSASRIKKVKISWYAGEDDVFYYHNFDNSGTSVSFPSTNTKRAATPPTISLAMVQTASTFQFSDFDTTHGSTTDRGMIYLVPTGNATTASTTRNNYIAAYNGSKNVINKNGFLNSNDKTSTNKNLPYAVYCNYPRNTGSDFACSAEVELPDPVGGARSDDTFVFVVGLPYGKPTTDFALEFFCGDSDPCGVQAGTSGGGATANQANINGTQIEIDSTGRANDLFRRLQTRLESEDEYSLSIMGPLELLGSGSGGSALKKVDDVITEWNFEK